MVLCTFFVLYNALKLFVSRICRSQTSQLVKEGLPHRGNYIFRDAILTLLFPIVLASWNEGTKDQYMDFNLVLLNLESPCGAVATSD